MESHIVKITGIENLTHDVLRIMTERPPGYSFKPGQATEVSINDAAWKEEKRPFTFTCLPGDPFLEFSIKTYPAHAGVTNRLLALKPGDELIVHDVWGAITYQGEGLFIAGGAGVTPFIAILRYLYSVKQIADNKLIFANKTKTDIIHEEEFKKILGNNFINILSDERAPGYANGFITEEFLKEHISTPDKKFYVCGPPPMIEAVQGFLSNMGVKDNAVVVEL